MLLVVISVAAAVLILAVLRVAMRTPRRAPAAPVDLVPAFTPPAAAVVDAPSWWALGALSDARRLAAMPDAPLAEPLIWQALDAERMRVKAAGPVGWAPPSGHAVTLPTDALAYDRFQVGAPA
jgi:hypothetical protein